MSQEELILSDSEQKLRRAFASAFNMSEESIGETMQYASSPGWDSVAHMALVATLDSTFDIMLDTDDVLDLSSYGKAREILQKYGVQF